MSHSPSQARFEPGTSRARRSDAVRVLHLTAGSDAGGVSRYLLDLCAALHAQGHQVAVAGERGVWHAAFEAEDWPWIETPLKGGPMALWRSADQLERYLRKHPVDVVHCHYRRAAMVGRRLQRRLGVPMLFTLHLTGVPLGPVRRRLSDFGDRTHAPSKDARYWLIHAANVPAERIELIPHGIQPERFPHADEPTRAAARAQLGLPDEATVAAYVGRLDVPKNEGWLLDLAKQSRQALPTLQVVMMGGGPNEAALRRRIERERLSDRVRLLGPGDPLGVYQACDVLLLPSAREGFALVCAEAMSVGRAVLRTRTAGAHETVLEGKTGRSVTVDREAFLAEAVRMLADRDALRRMGEAGAAHVRERLSFQQQFEQTLTLYRRMAANE